MANQQDIIDALALIEEARTDARKELAKALLDRIVDNIGGNTDSDILNMVMGELTEIEENG